MPSLFSWSSHEVEDRGNGECRDQGLDLALAMRVPDDGPIRCPGKTVQEQIQEDAGVE